MSDIPVNKGLAGKIFDRRRFLSGDEKTLYAPGQGQAFFDPISQVSDPPYVNPDKWPEKGAILRHLQVIYLVVGGQVPQKQATTLSFTMPVLDYRRTITRILLDIPYAQDPVYITPNQTPTITAQTIQFSDLYEVDYTFPYQTRVENVYNPYPNIVGTQTYHDYSNTPVGGPMDPKYFYVGTNQAPIQFTYNHYVNYSEPIENEHDRLLDVFNQVADFINSTREGITYVEVLDLDNLAFAYPPWLLAPGEEPESYLGTDFLMIFANGIGSPETRDEDIARISKAYPNFPRYRVKLYSMPYRYFNANGSFPDAPQYPVPDTGTPTIPVPGIEVYSNRVNIIKNNQIYKDKVDDLNANLNPSQAQIDYVTELFKSQDERSMEPLADYGGTYEGSSLTLTVSSLKQMISDRFK